jgi:hypothetical protein
MANLASAKYKYPDGLRAKIRKQRGKAPEGVPPGLLQFLLTVLKIADWVKLNDTLYPF